MKKVEEKRVVSELKKQILKEFSSIKFVNEYNKNGTTVIEIYTPDRNEEAINELTSKLCTEILINYGQDVLVLVYEDPKVLEWYFDGGVISV